jgi:D-tyrosyl-tRNA(Tyr) deacylase
LWEEPHFLCHTLDKSKTVATLAFEGDVMKAVVQRVSKASVSVDGVAIATIERGLLTLLGVAKGDDEARVQKAIEKICALRIFEDADGKMNLSVKDVGGAHLIVSQFTLLGDCSRGARPSFVGAEEPERARALYELALKQSAGLGVPTQGGQFRAHMHVSLVNDGPVTMLLEF